MCLSPKTLIPLFLWIIGIVGIGAAIGFTSGSAAENVWYQNLVKSELNPPGIAFAIVWPTLYALMGFGAWWIFHRAGPEAKTARVLLVIQLLVNFAWSYVFFTFHQAELAFVWILALIGLVIAWIVSVASIDKRPAYAQIPYLCWLCFAAYLSGTIVILN